MELTRSEKNRHKTISTGVAILVFALLVLILIYKTIQANQTNVTVLSQKGTEGGAALQTMLVESSHATEPSAASSSKQSSAWVSQSAASPVQSPDQTDAEKLANQFIQHHHRSGASATGQEDGIPSSGTTKGLIPGPQGNGGDSTVITNQLSFDVKGRRMKVAPEVSRDTKEAGKVVVDIIVDKLGNVIAADPNGRGTTTTSAALRVKARQAVLTTKFSESKTEGEQRGRMTFVFTYQ